ncbi:ANM_HP_G0058320.mRNA.1.CDS.1 [Saccharomyces cerevisiae]|nr:ANM_HP_G0058320.mRNA.1.CDS.1 [Saccharomyces cerevisiae]CAI7028619.1 ANM_HP_G0058320.mRNA.1.CDS.1 [Saccharomyces cerevisiae]
MESLTLPNLKVSKILLIRKQNLKGDLPCQVSMGITKSYLRTGGKPLSGNMAQLTAIIDFADDNSQEIQNTDEIFHDVEKNIICLRDQIVTFMQKVEKSTILQNGIKLVLLGAPNVGKSSLVNSLTNDDISIVSDIPGTTRDSIDAMINVNGYKVIICDTAGIRERVLTR